MNNNVINLEEVLEERDEALEKALKESLYYQKKYFSCLKDNEILEEMNKTMEKFIKQISE